MGATFGKLVTVGLLVGLAACSKKTPEPLAAVATSNANAAPNAQQLAVPPTANAGGEGKLDPNDPKHGTRKLMGLDAPVYVDGVQIAIMRFGEMANLPATVLEGKGRRYKIYDYLASIGVDPQTIKSVHFHGNGDRIASIEGSELRKEKDRFKFSFISGNTGTPLQKWATEHLKNEFVIHEIRRMTIYVKKPSPVIDPQRQCHVGADGECTEAIPYATGEIAKGTRVYLDGKMVGFVKRRQIGDGLIVSGSLPNSEGRDDTRYSVTKLIAQMGVDPTGVKTLELVAGDDVIARATSDQFKQLDTQTYFTLPPHNHGKVRVHVPADLQAKEPGATDRDGLVSSVLLYKSTTPPADRDLVAISEDTDTSVQVASVDDARAKLGRREQ